MEMTPGSPRYKAETIAKWFVAWAQSEDGDLSNLKLQKLLYYAQGHHLGRTGEPLFADRIEAWSHGPVVPAVYQSFKGYGSGDLSLADDDPFSWEDVSEETTQFLIDVWDRYGVFGAWQLRNMTHEEAPWKEAFQPNELHIVISQDVLRKYFAHRQ
jgi:uncharacterized phage-associated protein